jgi:hypothetical protein
MESETFSLLLKPASQLLLYLGGSQELEKLLVPHGVVLAGHCTGWRGKQELANTLPGRYQPCVVGGQWVFEAHD